MAYIAFESLSIFTLEQNIMHLIKLNHTRCIKVSHELIAFNSTTYVNNCVLPTAERRERPARGMKNTKLNPVNIVNTR